MGKPDRRQFLSCFMSVDIVNGTLFKTRHQARIREGHAFKPEWPRRFNQIFYEFYERFAASIYEKRDTQADTTPFIAMPRLWKINGDELLFHHLVSPDPQVDEALGSTATAFAETVTELDRKLIPEGLGLRGCVWTAGFPIRNSKLRYPRSRAARTIMLDDESGPDFDTGTRVQPGRSLVTDFIGPDIDLGFRLAGITPPGRICFSLDVAWLLRNLADRLNIYHVGWRRLKGIADGNPYPLLWMDPLPAPEERTPWDLFEPTNEIQKFLSCSGADALSERGICALAEKIWEQLPDYFQRPYTAPDELTEIAKAVWDEEGETAPEEPLDSDYVDLDWIDERAQLDTLSQVSLKCRKSETASVLRELLIEIAELEEYQRWYNGLEFRGGHFRLPVRFAPEGRKRRRLLEDLDLVVEDVLRIRINWIPGEDALFATDGLFVHQGLRVFPFLDESDVLRREYLRLGWREWPDAIIDPAVGCGHNLLRFDGSNVVERLGFDVSSRAIAYAVLNSQMRRSAAESEARVTFGLNDIADGLPKFFGGERILFLVNMPMAIEPIPGMLVPTAAGGQMGHELTLKALDSISSFGRLAARDGRQVRALVLTYSLGALDEDRWFVPEKAREIFGEKHVEWKVLEDERLWRVNGVKEEPNPMPLSSIRKKARDVYYMDDPRKAQEYEDAYVRVESELRDDGFDHLAYGVLHVVSPNVRPRVLGEARETRSG